MLLKAVPLIFRKRRATSRRSRASSAPVALTLVAAEYDADGPRVVLTFDRAVNIDAFDGTQVLVNDPLYQAARFDGTGGATIVSPGVVQIMLVNFDLPSGTSITLDASTASGIVAVDDGGTWAGASDLELPFP